MKSFTQRMLGVVFPCPDLPDHLSLNALHQHLHALVHHYRDLFPDPAQQKLHPRDHDQHAQSGCDWMLQVQEVQLVKKL